MNNLDIMLDCGKKIPISIGSVINLKSQDYNCYFILEGNLDGSITFDTTDLNDISNFNFNVLCDDITAVGTLQFKFQYAGEEITNVGCYEMMKYTEFELEPTRVYCFTCSVVFEGILDYEKQYSAAVNLAYVTNKMPLKYIQPIKTGPNIGDVASSDYSFDFSITQITGDESEAFLNKSYAYGILRQPAWQAFTNSRYGLALGQNGSIAPAGVAYILEFEQELKIRTLNYEMNVGSAWGNNVFNVFGYDETNEEWKHLGNVDTKKQFNFNPSAGPEYMASITLKFSIADYFKKYKITLDKYNQSETLYYKDSGLEVPKEYCISSCICRIQIDGLYIPILT